MQEIRHFGQVGCQCITSFVLNDSTVKEVCDNHITQYAFAALAVGIVGFVGRKLFVSYYQQDLLKAAKFGNLTAVKTEIANRGNLNVKDPLTGNTAAHFALENGHFGVFKALFAAGAALDVPNLKKETSLHIASKYNRPEAVELILSRMSGVDVNAKDTSDATALMNAAERGYHRNVAALLKIPGLQLDAQNNHLQTALHLAAREHADVVKLLLEKGASPDIEDDLKYLPLHYASSNDNAEGLNALIPATKDCNHKDKDGSTALHLTVHHIGSRLKSAEVLLRSDKVNPDEFNADGETALHDACSGTTGNHELALLMIRSKRFDLNLRTNDQVQNTAAHIAAGVRGDGDKILLALIEHKADLSISNGEGKSLIRIALEKRRMDALSKIIAPLTKEELEKINVEGLTLIEWATLLCVPSIEEMLNLKGVYFKFNADNKDKIIKKSEDITIDDFQRFFKITLVKIKEFREFVEDLQNPDRPQQQPELVALFRQAVVNTFERRAIVADHKQKGKHVIIAELFGTTIYDLKWHFLSLISTLPEAIKKRFEKLMDKSEMGPEPEELAALQARLPPALRFILEREISIEELKVHWPTLLAFIQAHEAEILRALQHLPV